MLRVGSQVSRRNLLEFEALPFDCRIDHKLWLVVFVGNPRGPVHVQITNLFFNLCDGGIQICCTRLLRIVGFQV